MGLLVKGAGLEPTSAFTPNLWSGLCTCTPPTRAADGTFRVLCVCLTYQEEEAGTTLPANHLLLLALEDLYLKWFFSLQVLRPPGSHDASEVGTGNAR